MKPQTLDNENKRVQKEMNTTNGQKLHKETRREIPLIPNNATVIPTN